MLSQRFRSTARAFLLVGLAASLVFSSAACSPDKKNAVGKYWLAERPTDTNAPDAIEFRADGTCLVDSGEHQGIPGTFSFDHFGSLTVDTGSATETTFISKYKLLNYTLVLTRDDGSSLYYVRLLDGPHPTFSDILGTFKVHTEIGDSAGEITANRKFRGHLHDLVKEEKTYYDINMDGTCTYADGIVTYTPAHSDAPEEDKYLRDFIVKRDKEGLWIIDWFNDKIVCETPATNLDLPPPPEGYRKAGEP